MRPSFKCLIPLLLLLAASAPAAAAEGPPVALIAGGATRLELASGERLTLPLPAGAEVAATTALADGWLAAGTTAGSAEIVLLTARSGGKDGIAALPPPPGRAGRLRREPLPLVADGRLAGLVWLEGDGVRRLAVRFARWDGAAWETPRTVSPAGPGSQLALTAARLADGTWLLAWSAFDGHDDEIVWSRLGSEGAWSRPQRVAADNDVPDITPSLVADPPGGDGALLAWSRYDGAGYRVVLARFRAGRWEAPREVGPAGSLYPSFAAGASWLLFATAVPHGWSVLELDGDGRPGRTASLITPPSARNERPQVVPGAGGVTFRFPAAATETTAPWGAAGERRP